LGDDRNDIELLKAAGYPITHSGAKQDVIELVRSNPNGYVSNCPSPHHATGDMLRHVLYLLDGK